MAHIFPLRRKLPLPVVAPTVPEPSIWNADPSALALDREAERARLARQFWTVSFALSISGLTCAVLISAFAIALSDYGNLGTYFYMLAATSLTLWAGPRTVQNKRFVLNAYASKAEERLLDTERDPSELLVEVWIVQDGAVTGIDRGMIAMDDDVLIFTGNRSSFCLGSQDLLRYGGLIGPRDATQSISNGISIYLETARYPLTLVIRPVKRRGPRENVHAHLQFMLKSLVSQPATNVTRQYPPLQLDPLLPSPYRYRPSLSAISLTIFLAVATTLPFQKLDTLLPLLALIPLSLDVAAWLLGAPRRARNIGRLNP